MTSSLLKECKTAFPTLALRENEPMSAHTSFHIGGPAAVMALPGSAAELTALCAFLRQKGEKPFIMGNGTNLLVTDAPLERFVVKTCEGAGRIDVCADSLTAECGALLSRVAAVALNAGLTGLEFAAGIPGSVGGAVCMNAGAYGGEIRNRAVKTDYLDEELTLRQAVGEAQGFAYRRSAFSERDCVILRTEFSLAFADREQIAAQMRELGQKRRASQPLEQPSAGSTFKRPENGYAAALIDQAGLKGCAVGGAMVSPKHAGFVVNAGGASCGDVLRLMEHIQKTVLDRFGVELTPEVRILRG